MSNKFFFLQSIITIQRAWRKYKHNKNYKERDNTMRIFKNPIHFSIKEKNKDKDNSTIYKNIKLSNTKYRNAKNTITYEDIENQISKTYYSEVDFYSTAFDIISTYIKGQKILYTEAQEYCVFRLNLLMLPAIALSAIASVLSLTVETYKWGSIVIASMNAFNGFLLSLVNYSKLDAASEAHKITSHQYDKLQSFCEFTSGYLLVIPNDDSIMLRKDVKDKLHLIENKIKDIKETNSFIIPSTVRSRFMNIYYTNIFSLVKKMSEMETILINNIVIKENKLRDMENDNNYENKPEYETLRGEKNELYEEIMRVKNRYMKIDKMFKDEIRYAEILKRRGWFISKCCYPKSNHQKHDNIEDTYKIKRTYGIQTDPMYTMETYYKKKHKSKISSMFNITI